MFVYKKGFTIIEMMIMVVIVSVLAAVATPIYIQYLQTSKNNACLAEVKGYAQSVIYQIADKRPVDGPVVVACSFITDANGWTTMHVINATSRGDRNSVCQTSGSCTLQ